MSTQQTVAVIGAGGMIGFGMAQNLARSGFAVRAWNRTHEKALPLTDDGAKIFADAEEAVRGADVIVSILFDAAATQAVLFGDDDSDGAGAGEGEDGNGAASSAGRTSAGGDAAAGALSSAGPDAILVQMGTLGARGTAACAEAAARRGLRFVDAPVVGTKAPALAGKLTILASGDEALEPHVAPIFDAIGQRTLWVGGSGAGTDLKLVVNSWIVSVVEGVAESFALAEGLGLDPQRFLDAVQGGPLDPGYLALKGKAILDRDFSPSFSLSGGAKDARLVTDAAEELGLDLPVLAAIRDRMEQGAADHGDEDIIATYRTSAPR